MSAKAKDDEKPQIDDCFVWSGDANICPAYARVTAVRDDDDVMQCSGAGRVWVTVVPLPLPEGFTKRAWSTAELLETIR